MGKPSPKAERLKVAYRYFSDVLCWSVYKSGSSLIATSPSGRLRANINNLDPSYRGPGRRDIKLENGATLEALDSYMHGAVAALDAPN